MESNSEGDLRSALTAFETSVTTPIVSGALADWAENAAKSWSDASAKVHFQAREAHPRQLEQIAATDPALLQQVELLRAEDEAIERDRAHLNQMMSNIAHQIKTLEPDEAKARPQIQSVIDAAVPLVARVRQQEVAIQTWFAEAFNQERGGGD